jgi:hypothetical protein
MEQIAEPTPPKRGRKSKVNSLVYFAQGIRALDMRRLEAISWGEIAARLGLEGENAENTALIMARSAKKKLAEESAEELREAHHARYEFMYKSLIPKIAGGRERAIEVAAKVLENDAKLMGINSDAETQQGNFQPIVIQIQPAANDPEAQRLAREQKKFSAKDAIIDQPKLLPPSDQGV